VGIQMKAVRIVQFYPELLSIYADRGNVIVLQKHAERRGLKVQLLRLRLGDRFDPGTGDIAVMGGGQDRDQDIVSTHLRAQLSAISDFVAAGGPLLAVCGSYQLLGHSYTFELHGKSTTVQGLGLIDMNTITSQPRLIGEIEIEAELTGPDGEPFTRKLVGFENHAGRTVLGPSVKPLGRVIQGFGNDGASGFEGAQYKNLIGTYMHGPMLPRNPWLTEYLMDTMTSRVESSV
jgi:CobQ-like glutamine amidotransferase family enzyme